MRNNNGHDGGKRGRGSDYLLDTPTENFSILIVYRVLRYVTLRSANAYDISHRARRVMSLVREPIKESPNHVHCICVCMCMCVCVYTPTTDDCSPYTIGTETYS